MPERQGIVGIIMQDVSGVMDLVKQKNTGQTDIDLKREEEVEARLENLKKHNRGDLVSLELLSYTLDRDPKVREVALKGLLDMDGSFSSMSVIKRVVDMGIFIVETEDGGEEVATAKKLLKNHLNDGDFFYPISRVINKPIGA